MINRLGIIVKQLMGGRIGRIYYIGGSDVLPPPLAPEQEQSALTMLEQGDAYAKQLLIERNLRLVVFISRRFENTGIPIEDLIKSLEPSFSCISKHIFTSMVNFCNQGI